jgi:hypothetical protein
VAHLKQHRGVYVLDEMLCRSGFYEAMGRKKYHDRENDR